MKIRNIQEYIADKCKIKSERPSLSYLFGIEKDNEPFLFSVIGDDGNIQAIVEDCANFAKDPEQQVFYEFVQNAFDAGADSAFFFMGSVNEKDYLVVANNGKPFYTDNPNLPDKELREGQLFTFLNKRKSRKKNAIGKHGIGSKLLYPLLCDNDEEHVYHLEDLLTKSLIENRRAPYVVSWNEGTQIDNLLFNSIEWDRNCGYQNEELLIAKIFCCYYPVEPGIPNSELFPDEEVEELRQVILSLIDPKRDINRLQNSGTIIIIPLGKGKLTTIQQPSRLHKIEKCLAPFAKIVEGYEQFEGKHIDRIFINGKEITSINADTICTDVKKGGNDNTNYRYQFVFSESFLNDECVNLYKALPISESTYKLNFIVDSQDLSTAESRQVSNEEEVDKANITRAMNLLVKELDRLLVSDKPKFDRIYNCLKTSHPDNDIVKTPFEEVLIPYLKKHIRTVDGDYSSFDNVINLTSAANIPLTEIGINDLHAVADDICNDYSKWDIEIAKKSLKDIFDKADSEKLSIWIKSLNDDDYAKFHNEVIANITEYSSTALLRTNKSKVVSLDDILSAENAVFPCDFDTDCFSLCDSIEYVTLPIGDAMKKKESYVWSKLSAHKTEYTTHEQKDFACALLSVIYDKLTSDETESVRTTFKILANRKGELTSFADLFEKCPDETVLFVEYLVKAPKPSKILSKWFVASGEQYNWISRHWNDIISFEDWNQFSDKYVKDIQGAWKKDARTEKVKQKQSLYLDENGIPQTTAVKFILGTGSSTFAEEDYRVLSSVFSGEQIVPFKYRNTLTTAPFTIEKVGLDDLIDDSGYTKSLTKKQIDALIKTVNNFWDNYYIKECDGSYQVSSLDGDKNLYSPVPLTSEQQTMLDESKYHIIPSCFYTPALEEYSISGESKLIEVIDSCNDTLQLWPFLAKCTTNKTLSTFFGKSFLIEFAEKETVDKYDLRWQLIKWVSESQSTYCDTIWKKLRYAGEALPDALPANKVQVSNGSEYEAYKLISSLEINDSRVDTLETLLPDGNFFETKYCTSRRNTMTATDVIGKLPLSALTVYQLEFALDYATNEKPTYQGTFELASNESLPDALNRISDRKFKNFYKKFLVPGLNVSSQIYASNEILIAPEKLPKVIFDWVKENEAENLKLFGDSLLDKHQLLDWRRKMLNGGICSDLKPVAEKYEWLISNTRLWLQEQIQDNKFQISKDSINQRNIEKFYSVVSAKDYINLPLLRYSSVLSTDDDLQFDILCASNLSEVKFLELSKDHKEIFCNYIKEGNTSLINFLKNNKVCLLLNKDLKLKHSLGNNPELTVKNESSESAFTEEWDDATYGEWLPQTELSNDIKIYITKDKILSKLVIYEGESKTLEIQLTDGVMYGTEWEGKDLKKVAVMYPNDTDDNSEYKALETKVVTNVSKFRLPFIALQGMKLAALMDKPNVDVDYEKLELIKDLSFDELKQQLQMTGNGPGSGGGPGGGSGDGPKQDKEEPEKPNMISGYLGELLYKGYLEKKLKLYVWSAIDENEPAFDFHVEGEFYVEVKTNVRTIKDGESPFYLHKSQMQFLRENDTDKYFICRISLTDLSPELARNYAHIRDSYGKYTDPRLPENEKIAAELKNLSQSYWQNTLTIEHFEETRRIYRIKDIFREVVSIV